MPDARAPNASAARAACARGLDLGEEMKLISPDGPITAPSSMSAACQGVGVSSGTRGYFGCAGATSCAETSAIRLAAEGVCMKPWVAGMPSAARDKEGAVHGHHRGDNTERRGQAKPGKERGKHDPAARTTANFIRWLDAHLDCKRHETRTHLHNPHASQRKATIAVAKLRPRRAKHRRIVTC